MIRNNINIYAKSNPVLIDRILQDIQSALTKKLVWLDYAFGRAYKLVEYGADGNKFTYPAIYSGNGEYTSVLPNDMFGNFSWFDIYDPQKLDQSFSMRPQYSFDGAIVFWYNLSEIYEDKRALYTEDIKNEILKVLASPGIISSNGRLSLNEIYEKFENIYKGYSIENDKINRQFFIYPYSGIRIEFTITTKELC